MDVTIYDSISELDMHEWDEVVGPNQLFQRSEWLRALEGGGLADCTPKYFVVRDASGRMVASASAYIIPTSLVLFSKGFVRSAVERIRRLWPSFLMPRILECGCPTGLGRAISLRSTAAVEGVVERLCEAFEDLARRERLRVLVIRDFDPQDVHIMQPFVNRGFGAVDNLPTTRLDIAWPSFDAFVDDMQSRHRSRLRKRLKLAERNGLQARFCMQGYDAAEELDRQTNNVDGAAKDYNRSLLTPTFYRQGSRALGARWRVLDIWRDGRVVANALLLSDGPILRWLSFGRDIAGARDGAHFLVMATIVRTAIEERFECIDMGLTTYATKQEFGAQIVPLKMCVRFRPNIFGPALPRVLQLLSPKVTVADRQIFKSLRNKSL